MDPTHIWYSSKEDILALYQATSDPKSSYNTPPREGDWSSMTGRSLSTAHKQQYGSCCVFTFGSPKPQFNASKYDLYNLQSTIYDLRYKSNTWNQWFAISIFQHYRRTHGTKTPTFSSSPVMCRVKSARHCTDYEDSLESGGSEGDSVSRERRECAG